MVSLREVLFLFGLALSACPAGGVGGTVTGRSALRDLLQTRPGSKGLGFLSVGIGLLFSALPVFLESLKVVLQRELPVDALTGEAGELCAALHSVLRCFCLGVAVRFKLCSRLLRLLAGVPTVAGGPVTSRPVPCSSWTWAGLSVWQVG